MNIYQWQNIGTDPPHINCCFSFLTSTRLLCWRLTARCRGDRRPALRMLGSAPRSRRALQLSALFFSTALCRGTLPCSSQLFSPERGHESTCKLHTHTNVLHTVCKELDGELKKYQTQYSIMHYTVIYSNFRTELRWFTIHINRTGLQIVIDYCGLPCGPMREVMKWMRLM